MKTKDILIPLLGPHSGPFCPSSTKRPPNPSTFSSRHRARFAMRSLTGSSVSTAALAIPFRTARTDHVLLPEDDAARLAINPEPLTLIFLFTLIHIGSDDFRLIALPDIARARCDRLDRLAA